MQTIGIIGAGPVGSLLSLFLAARGFCSELYERRSDIRTCEISAGRSINMAVSTRGLYALRQMGLEQEILKQAVPMYGRMIHSLTGELSFQRYGMSDAEHINSISRAGLNKTLMTFAEATGKVRIHFQRKATGIDLETGQLEFRTETSQTPCTAQHSTIIATDGSASVIRSDLFKKDANRGVCTQDFLEYGYKELTIPPHESGGFALEKNALHIWPRGTFMLIALPNFDGSFTCTLFLPLHGSQSFDALSSENEVEAFFRSQFPDVVPLIADLKHTFFSNPTGHMVTVRCEPWYFSDKVLLMGDAAHAIVPFFGQGMNCGFEDCTLFDEILERSLPNLDWQKCFSEFSTLRKPHTDGIAEMAIENFIEMRDKVGNARFLMEKEIEKQLQSKFKGKYISRYALVTFSRIPYQVAYQAGQIENEILSELCQDLTDPRQMDWEKAAQLIESKLTPVLHPYL